MFREHSSKANCSVLSDNSPRQRCSPGCPKDCQRQGGQVTQIQRSQANRTVPCTQDIHCCGLQGSKGHLHRDADRTGPLHNQSRETHHIRPCEALQCPNLQCQDLVRRPLSRLSDAGPSGTSKATTLHPRPAPLLQMPEVRPHSTRMHNELQMLNLCTSSSDRSVPEEEEGGRTCHSMLPQLQGTTFSGIHGLSYPKREGQDCGSKIHQASPSRNNRSSAASSPSANGAVLSTTPKFIETESREAESQQSRKAEFLQNCAKSETNFARTVKHDFNRNHRTSVVAASNVGRDYKEHNPTDHKCSTQPASTTPSHHRYPSGSDHCPQQAAAHQKKDNSTTAKSTGRSRTIPEQETCYRTSNSTIRRTTSHGQHRKQSPNGETTRTRPNGPNRESIATRPDGPASHAPTNIPDLTSTIKRLRSRLPTHNSHSVSESSTTLLASPESQSPSLLILQWNVQGIRTFDKQSYVIASIKDLKPDVALLQETNLKPGTNFKIPGYYVYSSPAERGLITAVKHNIPSKKCNVPPNIGRNVELLVVDVFLKHGPLRLYNLYRNPNPTRHAVLDPVTLLASASQTTSVIAGDFNAHHHLWGTPTTRPPCTTGRKLADALLDSTMIVLNDGSPTHHNLGRIDLTITTPDIAPRSHWQVLDSISSDHFAITTTISVDKLNFQIPTSPIFNYKKANWLLFQQDLATFAAEYIPDPDLGQHNQDIVNAFQKAANTAIPLIKPRTPRQEAWYYTPEVQEAKHLVNQHVKFLKKHPSPEAKARLREAIQHAKEVCEEQRSQKWFEWCDQLNHHTSVSTMWKQIRRATGNHVKSPLHPDPDLYAEEINHSFLSRASNDNLPNDTRVTLENLSELRQDSIETAAATADFTDKPFDLYELQKALRTTNSSPGSDSITHLMISKAGPSGHRLLLDLINKSYSEGRLPPPWKAADVIPIPKPKQVDSFRPISLISCLSKLAERMVLNRLRWKVGPFNPAIFGFNPGTSTAHALTTFLHLATHLPASPAFAAFIDLEKAFELANAEVIGAILARKKVKGLLLKWTLHFLSDRNIRVRYQGAFSSYGHLDNGTPQGSVLSPFLFNLLMDSLLSLDLPPQVRIISYADDIALISTGPRALPPLQNALNRLQYKLECLGLKISSEKSKAMAIRTTDPPQALTILQSPLQWVQTYQYLGIQLDKQLTMSAHIEYMQTAITKRLNIMRVLTSRSIGANSNVLRKFYVTSIRAIIDYAAPVLIIAKSDLLLKLDKLQNVALRIILGAPQWTNIKTMQEETGLIPIQFRIIQIATSFLLNVTRHRNPLTIKDVLVNNLPRLDLPTGVWSKHAKHLQEQYIPEAARNQDIPVTPDPPPWEPPAASFMVSLPQAGKKNTNPHELKTDALHRIAQLNQNKTAVFYTDGSVTKDPSRAGVGVVIRALTNPTRPIKKDISIRASDHTTTLQTELLAICAAVVASATSNFSSSIIHTDSLSALHAINAHIPSDNRRLISTIHQQLRKIADHGGQLILHWIPSHVGVPLNEMADQLAFTATQKQTIQVHTQPSKSHLKTRISSRLHQQWRNLNSRSLPTSRSLTWRRTTSQDKRHCTLTFIPRQLEVRIFRLRLGYRCIWEIANRQFRDCSYCDAPSDDPLLHYVLECPLTSQHFGPTISTDTDNSENIAALRVQTALHNIPALLNLLQRYPPPR